MEQLLPYKISEQMLKICIDAINKANIGMAIIDSNNNIIFWNQWLQDKSGLSFKRDMQTLFLQAFPELKNSRLAMAIDSALKFKLPAILSQSFNKSPLPLYETPHDRNERIQQAIQVTPLESDTGARFCLIQVTDVSVTVKKERLLREQAETLRNIAFIDSLTGIPNRRRMDEYLAEELKLVENEKSSLSVIILDIDYFKYYNDTYGHQNGDFCLQRVANALKSKLRKPTDMIARYGGEEFVVILPNTPLNGAQAVAENMREHIETLAIPHQNSKISQHVTISLGIASTNCCAELSEKDLLTRADQALYEAKNAGRNRAMSIA